MALTRSWTQAVCIGPVLPLHWCLPLMLAGLLSGCVTETSGGFGVEPSESVALDSYLQLAVGYLDDGDLLNARRHLRNAAAIDGNNSELHAIWALVYAREGEPRLADESFIRALRIAPGNSKARNNYAAFLFAESRFADAHRELERVVQDTAYQGRAQAFENLGLAALRLNRNADAESAFTRALQLNRNQLRSSLELAVLNLQKPALDQAGLYYGNYITLLQLYNQRHSARSLWVGVQLENARGNTNNVRELGRLLEANFNASAEFQLYRQFLENLSND